MSLPTKEVTVEPKRNQVPHLSQLFYLAPFSAAVIGERVVLASAVACVIFARCLSASKAVTSLHESKHLLESFAWGAWLAALAHLEFGRAEIRQNTGVACILIAIALLRNRLPRGDIRRDFCTVILHFGVSAMTTALVCWGILLTDI